MNGKRIWMLLLAVLLALGLTACGSSDPESGEDSPVSGLTVTEKGGKRTIETDRFILKLGHADTWYYQVNEDDSLSLYNIEAKDTGWGGHLVTIRAFEEGDVSYEELPSYTVAGTKDGWTYVAVYPTDVQVNPENPEEMDAYRAVFQEVNEIREGGGPLTLK